ncbi:MAG: Fe-S-containing protein [Desulfarculales bacterium]|jgi:uncharacterized membrane protein|nr:Fe-S-containing protein [Desulfarculales bacterium]
MKYKLYKHTFLIVSCLLLASWAARVLPDLMLYPFEFKVGMESVFNQEYLLKALGYSLGLLGVFLLGLALYKITVNLSLSALVFIFSLCLLIYLSQQFLEISKIITGRNLVPRIGWMVSLVIFTLNYTNWFIYAMAIILGAVTVITWFNNSSLRLFRGVNPAEIRKEKSGRRTQRRFCLLLAAGLIFVIFTVTVLRYYENRGVELSPPAELPVVNGQIIIPLSEVDDGHLHRYVYEAENGTLVRYIIIKKNETAYGVGLDACDICGPTGYYERNDKEVICILCDVVMNIATIGFPGGCNPVPLKFSIAEGKIIIAGRDLERHRYRFE